MNRLVFVFLFFDLIKNVLYGLVRVQSFSGAHMFGNQPGCHSVVRQVPSRIWSRTRDTGFLAAAAWLEQRSLSQAALLSPPLPQWDADLKWSLGHAAANERASASNLPPVRYPPLPASSWVRLPIAQSSAAPGWPLLSLLRSSLLQTNSLNHSLKLNGGLWRSWLYGLEV